MLESGFAEFKIDYMELMGFQFGARKTSEEISVGGHPWRLSCYPRGYLLGGDDEGEYLSVYFQLMSDATNVRATFEAFLVDSAGKLSNIHARRWNQGFPPLPPSNPLWGWNRFVKVIDLAPNYVRDGVVTITWGIMVEESAAAVGRGDPAPPLPLPVPPSDIGHQLGALLDSAAGSDVLFHVGGEEFPAHRAVLAARSPVFKAQLHGSMADAAMPSITLHDVEPATFRAMLRFIYTDELPAADELSVAGSPPVIFHDLFVAADRYALDRLKLLCASKIGEAVTVDTVSATLSLVETYSCPELKEVCIAFLARDGNFQKTALTDDFLELLQKFPSIRGEIRQKLGS